MLPSSVNLPSWLVHWHAVICFSWIGEVEFLHDQSQCVQAGVRTCNPWTCSQMSSDVNCANELGSVIHDVITETVSHLSNCTWNWTLLSFRMKQGLLSCIIIILQKYYYANNAGSCILRRLIWAHSVFQGRIWGSYSLMGKWVKNYPGKISYYILIC